MARRARLTGAALIAFAVIGLAGTDTLLDVVALTTPSQARG
jgi:hypothetical protein